MNTGEFAAYCGVEKRTLFHYDQIGLLKPEKILENGYREYQLEQAEKMDTIKILQAAGYTLKEIKEILSRNENDRRTSLFFAQSLLENKIEELQSMKAYIDKKKRLWEEYQDFQKKGIEYQLETLDYKYSLKGLTSDKHFFSFLTDRNNDTLIMNSKEQIFLACEGESIQQSGQAIAFFMTIPSNSPNLLKLIQEKLNEFHFKGEEQYFINIIPHMFFDAKGKAIVKVVVLKSKQSEA